MRHEVEVDTKLADLYERLYKVNASLDANKLTLARLCGIRPTYVTRNRTEILVDGKPALVADLIERLRARLDSLAAWERRDAEKALANREGYMAELAAIRDAMKPLDADFDANRWSRFFLVKNHGGHIHSSMSCSTCFPTTRFGWLPDLSGLTEKDAVDAHGPLLCSVCFPTAPVEWTLGKKDDDDKCVGSGTYDHTGFRRTSYTGSGRATCKACGESVGVTTTGKIRAHKAKVTA